MQKCANCGAAMSCTCQTRRSTGGKVGCTNCIGSLNAADRQAGILPKAPVKPTANPPLVNKAVVSNTKKPNT